IYDNTHDHYIRWYSVENGLEMDGGLDNNYFSTQQGGHYFFTATNCNDYVYTSDTIEVIISQLQTPSFRSDPRAEDICEGDSILLDNIDFAQNIDWWVDYYKAENHNLPYYIPSYENSEDYLRVEVSDHYGCTQSVFSQLKYVLEAPYLPTRDYYICSSAEYVSLDLPYLSVAIWEGFSNDQHLPVSEGSYPITVTNGVCPDLETSIYVHEFDPLPFNTTDTTLALGDTLKVQGSGQNFPQSWSYDWTFDWQKNELFITSNLPSTYTVQLGYFSHCWRSYTLNIEFKEIILNSPIPTGQFLYPNPTDGRVHFNNSKNEISNIEILDLNGKKLAVIHTIPVNLNASLNLSDYLSSGSYILWFNYNNGTTSQHKVVLN
ncbi:MAG: T9SS type A sorting domain-containing protein, partial [Marinoscillum sp.]